MRTISVLTNFKPQTNSAQSNKEDQKWIMTC
jgi:hypothetical protein